MLKTICLQLLLLGVLACNSGKKGSETTKANDSTSDGSPQDASAMEFRITPITFDNAKQYYKQYADEIKKPKGLPIHYCSTEVDEGDTLRYARFLRGTINDSNHIPDFDTTKLADNGFRKEHTGIRLYPYQGGTPNAYLMVYTVSVDESDSKGEQRDDTTTFHIVTVKADWCKLAKHVHPPGTENLRKSMMNHRLCDPDCPDNPSLKF